MSPSFETFLTESAALSDIGKVRSANEDTFYINDSQAIFLIADGMGGTDFGRAAADIVRTVVPEYCGDLKKDLPSEQVLDILNKSYLKAHEKIREMIEESVRGRSAGTTADTLVLKGGQYFIAHIGDSRVYLLREKKMTLLTKDHSYLQKMIDSGIDVDEEFSKSFGRHILTRCLGCEDRNITDLLSGDVRSGDIFCLCTDGLHGYVSGNSIQNELLKNSLSNEKICKNLVNSANEAGGNDNVTVIVIKIPPGR